MQMEPASKNARARQPGSSGLLFDRPIVRADKIAQNYVRSAHADVLGPAQKIRPPIGVRCDADRGPRAGAGTEGGPGNRLRKISRALAWHSLRSERFIGDKRG